MILESIFARRLPTQKTVAALALTYLGIAVVMREDLQRTATLATDSRDLWFGSALIFCASITYAIYLARSRPLISELGSRRFTGIVLSGACVCSLAFQFATQPLEGLVQGPRVYAISLALAIISTVLPSWMLAKAIAVVGSSKTALIGCIGPVFTLLLATAFLGEPMGPAHLVGAALVLFGVWMISGAALKSSASR